MGLTENNSLTHLSSGNPCLDFFFQVVPDTSPDTVVSLLSSAWARDPLAALKLVCHLRGVRGTGKSDREGFYASALWLHSHHPKTLALNVPSLAHFGYIKDLLEILYRLIHGADARSAAKEERETTRRAARDLRRRRQKKNDKNGKQQKKDAASREDRIAAELSRATIASEKAAGERRSKRTDLAARSLERYSRDPEYRFLHDRIADFFAERLASDAERLRAGKPFDVGLARQVVPLSRLVVRPVHPPLREHREEDVPKDHPDYVDLEDEHYAYRVRLRLRRDVLVPLREALDLPEVYMSGGRWGSPPYSRVASVAMKNYTKIFKKHDEERFDEYLSKVKEGKAKIAAGALLPHEILASVREEDDDGTNEVAELQWQRMVRDMTEKGSLKSCIAVCDVSGSMGGNPMEVCIALGILTSEVSEEPWKGRVITFSGNPQLHKIEGGSLKEKMRFVRSMDWGMNTDFQKVFDRLLEVAVEGKLEKEKMIRRIFVFSDMEFDQASANNWGTDYEVICRKFQESGYGDCVPEIVFWNLRDSRSTPVPSTQKGVAMVSGFSKNLLKLFLEEGKALSPEVVMEDAISGKEYQNLVVFD
ncbi:uncharacterized protein M6B38_321130 [Iris pallida]|uniref:Uncharacterized protein n=1 Tax=Iris pallida TaxID=29817 RepID=A0AAX6HD40_IRIPA|nr:uncharacterized protein M6B38_321130 [Iris pallida]